MKYFLLIIIFRFCFICSYAQIYSGQLIDSKSGEPIPYANIGIIGRNVGTASDVSGQFKLELTGEYDKDTLCISCIGYESKKFLLGEFKAGIKKISRIKIDLSPKVYLLPDVVIKPNHTKIYTLGDFCEPNSAYGNAFYSKELGTEIGVRIRLPEDKEKAYLRNFRFYVGKFTYDKFPVRLNIYNLKDDRPFQNLLEEQIFIYIKSAGEYIIDLTKYDIVIKEDFFISLEYYRIADKDDGELVFCAVHYEEINESNGFYRLASQGYWKHEISDDAGFSVQVECEE